MTHRILIMALTIAAAFGGYQYVKSLHTENALVKEQRDQANLHSAMMEASVAELREQIARDSAAANALAVIEKGINNGFKGTQIKLERLRHENQEFKRWHDTALPDDVVRMRQRPAINTTDEYIEWLSKRDTVHPATEPANAERQPASGN